MTRLLLGKLSRWSTENVFMQPLHFFWILGALTLQQSHRKPRNYDAASTVPLTVVPHTLSQATGCLARRLDSIFIVPKLKYSFFSIQFIFLQIHQNCASTVSDILIVKDTKLVIDDAQIFKYITSIFQSRKLSIIGLIRNLLHFLSHFTILHPRHSLCFIFLQEDSPHNTLGNIYKKLMKSLKKNG